MSIDSGSGPSGAAASSTTTDLYDLAREQVSGSEKGSKKSESVVSDFNMLLASQMTAQRKYYEEEMRMLEGKQKLELKELSHQRIEVEAAIAAAHEEISRRAEANAAIDLQVAELASEEAKMRKKIQTLEGLNKALSAEQQKVEDQAAGKEEQRKAARKQRDKQVEELQQQIRDLELYVQMQKRCAGKVDTAEIQGSHTIITESASRGRGGRRPKKR